VTARMTTLTTCSIKPTWPLAATAQDYRAQDRILGEHTRLEHIALGHLLVTFMRMADKRPREHISCRLIDIRYVTLATSCLTASIQDNPGEPVPENIYSDPVFVAIIQHLLLTSSIFYGRCSIFLAQLSGLTIFSITLVQVSLACL